LGSIMALLGFSVILTSSGQLREKRNYTINGFMSSRLTVAERSSECILTYKPRL